MKRILFVSVLIVNTLLSFGQDFKILYLSSDSILIGNRILHAGDIFQASDVISWDDEDDMQNMTVQNQGTYVQKMVDRESLHGFSSLAEFENGINDNGSFLLTLYNSFKSFIDYYINADNHTSYRDGDKTDGMRSMEEILSQTYFLEDKICIPIFIPISECSVFILQTTIDGTDFSIPLTVENDCLCITRDLLFTHINNNIKALRCRIMYHENSYTYQLSNTTEIFFL